jgi:hypothetical protein
MLFPADEAGKKLYRTFTAHLVPWFTFASVSVDNREARLLIQCNGDVAPDKKVRLVDALTNMSRLIVHFGPPNTSLWARLKKCKNFEEAMHSVVAWNGIKKYELTARHSFEFDTGLVLATN